MRQTSGDKPIAQERTRSGAEDDGRLRISSSPSPTMARILLENRNEDEAPAPGRCCFLVPLQKRGKPWTTH